MSNVRTQIRDQVATTLTSLTTTGANVFTNRIAPVEQRLLPCLVVTTNSQTVTPLSLGGNRLLEARLDLTIEGYATGNSLDDTLDTIASEVQVAMTSSSLDALTKNVSLVSLSVNFADTSDVPAGYISVTYEIEFHYYENDPDTSI